MGAGAYCWHCNVYHEHLKESEPLRLELKEARAELDELLKAMNAVHRNINLNTSTLTFGQVKQIVADTVRHFEGTAVDSVFGPHGDAIAKAEGGVMPLCHRCDDEAVVEVETGPETGKVSGGLALCAQHAMEELGRDDVTGIVAIAKAEKEASDEVSGS